MNDTNGIRYDPDVMDGAPCVQGTRIPVWAVLRAIAEYVPLDDVAKAYSITAEQAKDALYFASRSLEKNVDTDHETR